MDINFTDTLFFNQKTQLMKNLKSLITIITLVFIVGTTLKAQDCFEMDISTEYHNMRTVVTITITNYSGESITINDDATGYTGTCPAGQQSHTITWFYRLDAIPSFNDITTTIECASNGLCRQYDGCTIVIDPRLI